MPYRTQVHIEPGAQTRDQKIVADSDTAISAGTGDVPVLATSQLFAWCDQASFELLAPGVPQGSTSVAVRVQLDHIRAASAGCVITIIATLERVEGRRYVCVVSALDDQNHELANGRVVRVLVEVQPFLAKASGPSE